MRGSSPSCTYLRRVASVNFTPPRTAWRGLPADFRKGTYNYAAPRKHVEALGLPNPREWQPHDADWKLPDGWKQTILDGMKDRLERLRAILASDRLLMDIVVRCCRGDWGDTASHGRHMNDQAVFEATSIVARYCYDQDQYVVQLDGSRSAKDKDEARKLRREAEAQLDLPEQLTLLAGLVLGAMRELGTNSSALHREVGEYAVAAGIDQF